MTYVRMNGGRGRGLSAAVSTAAVGALGVLGVLAGAGTANADPIFFGPTPYLSPADSPFSGVSFSTFHLENFEDGAFNTPGATPSAGWVVPGIQVLDSVDSDDGAINGTGASGRSYYSNGTQTVLTITFDPGVLGGLPTHAGIVWTDVGQIIGAGGLAVGDVIFEAFGPGNVSLGTIGPVTLGDGLISGETAEDRFFGVRNAGGITAIRISMPQSVDWEIDHVQYGIAIPAPGAAIVGLLGVAAGVRRRRSLRCGC